MSDRARHAGWTVGLPLLLGFAATARADDLRQALELAYRTNPTLLAQRATLRATDEQVPIERAAALPDVAATARYAETFEPSVAAFSNPPRSLNAGVTLSVPIYQGGRVRNATRAADTRVRAGQADLRGTESAVFSQVVGAYMDVVQNEAIVALNRKNVAVLEVNLQATRDRFEIGDLTRTDVAQSQSRLALARGDTRGAEANLTAARESYIRLIGKPPQALQPPPPLPNLPATPDDAVKVALDSNPDILGARERSRAAGYDVNVAAAGRLPQLSVFSGASYLDYLGSASGFGVGSGGLQSLKTGQVGVQASVPLFQGGRPAALRRQAQEREGVALEDEIGVERGVISQARAAYSSWRAAQEIIASSQTAVDAASLSLEGVRAENGVGNRTILDILNAEQELLSAQVRLVTARRNEYVAGFTLLAAMGRAEARDLGLDGGALYDPDAHYRQARRSWSDWADRPAPVASATRTTDTPAQTGDVPAEAGPPIEAQGADAPTR